MPEKIKFGKNDVTHTDFVGFLEPFFEPVTEKKYREIGSRRPKNEHATGVGEEYYKKYSSELRDRLVSCYILDESVELEDACFEKELVPLGQIYFKNDEIQFFSQKSILDEFGTQAMRVLESNLRRQIEINDHRAAQIKALILKRARVHGYFQAHELIHKELESIYRRIRTRRKKKQCDIEDATIREYLRRNREFMEAFGAPDQFPDNILIYPDVLLDAPQKGTPSERFTYLT